MVSGFFASHVKLLVRIIIDPSKGHPNLETKMTYLLKGDCNNKKTTAVPHISYLH